MGTGRPGMQSVPGSLGAAQASVSRHRCLLGFGLPPGREKGRGREGSQEPEALAK